MLLLDELRFVAAVSGGCFCILRDELRLVAAQETDSIVTIKLIAPRMNRRFIVSYLAFFLLLVTRLF
jgi:hypothetical protein